MSDLIDREVAIKAVHDSYDNILDFASTGKTVADSVEDILSKLLPVEPERVECEWIPHKSIFGGLGEKVYTCDKCGYNIGFRRENYCPDCGSYNGGEKSKEMIYERWKFRLFLLYIG